MDNKESKGLLMSKTFWASLMPILVAIGQLSDQYFHTNLMNSHVVGMLLTLSGFLGIYGRKTADTKIEGLI